MDRICRCLIYVFPVLMIACNSDDSLSDQAAIEGYRVIANNSYFIADGVSEVVLNVVDSNDEIVNNTEIRYYVDNEAIKSDIITSNQAKPHSVYAQLGDAQTETITIFSRAPASYSKVELQVILHVIHDSEDEIGINENFAAETIYRIFNPLNDHFNNSKPIANVDNPNKTAPHIYFRLATENPEGHPLIEPGIDRVPLPSSESEVSPTEEWLFDHFWDPDNYINVWIARTTYSQGIGPEFPETVAALPGTLRGASKDPYRLEGVFLNHEVVRNEWVVTFSHELGHFFGLGHVFSDDCETGTDFCSDTHHWLNPNNSFQESKSRISCDQLKYISTNIMDYSSGYLNTFTLDQTERMRYSLEYAKWRAQESLVLIDP